MEFHFHEKLGVIIFYQLIFSFMYLSNKNNQPNDKFNV